MNECAKKMSKRSLESIQRRQGIKIKNQFSDIKIKYDKIEYVTAIIGKNMMAVFYVEYQRAAGRYFYRDKKIVIFCNIFFNIFWRDIFDNKQVI